MFEPKMGATFHSHPRLHRGRNIANEGQFRDNSGFHTS